MQPSPDAESITLEGVGPSALSDTNKAKAGNDHFLPNFNRHLIIPFEYQEVKKRSLQATKGKS